MATSVICKTNSTEASPVDLGCTGEKRATLRRGPCNMVLSVAPHSLPALEGVVERAPSTPCTPSTATICLYCLAGAPFLLELLLSMHPGVTPAEASPSKAPSCQLVSRG